MTIQKILLHYEPGKENLLRAIKEINHYFGHVSKEAVFEIAAYFSMAPSAVYSTASFYDQINTKPVPALVIKVCDGANCEMKLSEKLVSEVEKFFGVRAEDENSPKVRIERVSCLGLCTQGPIMVINDTVFERVMPEKVDEILRNYV